MRRLFFDIETSPNVVYSWGVGYNISISYENIIKERAIICIAYKWEGEDRVRSLRWNKGDDKAMLEKFAKVMKQSDEMVAHNGDRYDIKFLRARCIFHEIAIPQTIVTEDTLKRARSTFRMNSNRLDYIGQYLGVGQKMDTGGFDLWKRVMDGERQALTEMVAYCEQDVRLLEKVYHRMSPYFKQKTHEGVLHGGDKLVCPKCASRDGNRDKRSVTAAGTPMIQLWCRDCNYYWTIGERTYSALVEAREKAKNLLSTR